MKNFIYTLILGFVLSYASNSYAQSAMTFETPINDTKINLQNVTKLFLQGNCDVAGELIELKAGSQAAVRASCTLNGTALKWSFSNVSVAAQADGPILFSITKVSAPTVKISRTFIKDTLNPILVINAPKNGDSIVASNFKNFNVSGLCSELGQPIQVTMKRAIPDIAVAPIVKDVVCPTSRQWSTSFDLTTLGDNTDVQLIATHTDTAGNEAIQSSSYYMDVQAITTGFAGLPASINSSNAASILINGTCNKENSYITLDASVDGTPYKTSFTTNCISGKWRFNTLSFAGGTVPDGTLRLSLTLLNPLTGLIGTSTAVLVKDTVAPNLSIASPAAGYRMTQGTGTILNLRGVCSDSGQAIAIRGARTDNQTCVSGQYNLNYDFAASPDGDHSFNVTHYDAAGNQRTQTISFNKDTLPASLTVDPLTLINTANATSVQFKGTCSEKGSYAQPVLVSGAINATASCQPDGTWTLLLSSFSIADGSLTFNFNHKDAAGNAAPQVSRVITKDTVPPSLTITAPVLPTLPSKFMINQANVGSVVFSGACDDASATITASNGLTGSSPCTSGRWSIAASSMTSRPDGDVTISFRIADAAGNGRQQDIVIFKDTNLPNLSLIGSPFQINIGSTANVILSGACSESTSFAQPVFVKGIGASTLQAVCQTTNSWSLSIAKTNFAEGTTNFTVEHSDLAGNKRTVSGSAIKDSTPPTLTLTTPGGNRNVNRSNGGNFVFSGTCSENGLSVLMSGAKAGSAVCTNGAYSIAMSLLSVVDGNLSFRATHTDAAGNSVNQDIVLVKDTTLPLLSFTAPAVGVAIDGTAVTFRGTCSEVGAAVTLSGNVTGATSCVANAWSFAYTGPSLADGVAYASQTDVAGNVGTASYTVKVQLPLVPPPFDPTRVIAAGGSHSCAVTPAGGVKCWGDNNFGQLGNNSTVPSLTPIDVPGLSGVVSVVSSSYDNCALLNVGTVKCWGKNSSGQIGNGQSGADVLSPTTVSGLTNVMQITGGQAQYCALISNGQVKCWGENFWFGFGIGSNRGNLSTPVAALNITDAVHVSTHYQNSCVVHRDGTVSCAGSQSSGILGSTRTLGSLGDSQTYVKVANLSNAVKVEVSPYHACALIRDGTVRCWGSNSSSPLGDPNVSWSTTVVNPVLVSGINNAVSINVGIRKSCALLSTGRVMCWGQSSPDGAYRGGYYIREDVTPVDKGYANVTAMSHGYNTICYVTSGQVKCGDQQFSVAAYPQARLANVTSLEMFGTSQNGAGGAFVTASGRALDYWGIDSGLAGVVKAVPTSDGFFASYCYVLSTGAVRCPSDFNNASLPSIVGAKTISAGENMVCSALADGTVRCWGRAYAGGIIGNGTAGGGANAFGQPTGITNAVDVKVTKTHACALLQDATVKCWGKNNLGQLGDGTQVDSLVPVVVSGLSGVAALSLGPSLSCARLTSGNVKCWGDGSRGYTGMPAQSVTLVPRDLGISGVRDISVPFDITWAGPCLALTDGTVRCISSGTLGAPIPGLTGAVKVSATSATSCALKADGSVHCWGYGFPATPYADVPGALAKVN